MELVADKARTQYTNELVYLILEIKQAPGSVSPKEGYYWGSASNISEQSWCPNESGDDGERDETLLFLRVKPDLPCFVDSHQDHQSYFVCGQGIY